MNGGLDEARTACLAGLQVVEQTDHQYRDTVRDVCLCVLGRTAMQQRDDEAARAHAEKVADDFAKVFQRVTAVRVTNDLGEVVFINRSA